MDFNAIYEVVKPYLGTGAIASGIITVIVMALKAVKVIKEVKASFISTESEAIKAFKKAIPESLYISVESLTKAELAKIKEETVKLIDERFLKQIKANTELTEAIAAALVSMKAIPDSAKEKITGLLELKEPKTTESLKVELLPTDEPVTAVKTAEKIYID